jgi:hypothetical protein
MLVRRGRHFGTTLLVVVALLWSQLALAGYLCPAASPASEVAMEMAGGEPCGGMALDNGLSVLCYQHCADAPQSLDAGKLPAPTLPAVVQVLEVPPPLVRDATAAHCTAADSAPWPPEPVFLSTLRLRV